MNPIRVRASEPWLYENPQLLINRLDTTPWRRREPVTAEFAEDAERYGFLCELGALCGEKLVNSSLR